MDALTLPGITFPCGDMDSPVTAGIPARLKTSCRAPGNMDPARVNDNKDDLVSFSIKSAIWKLKRQGISEHKTLGFPGYPPGLVE